MPINVLLLSLGMVLMVILSMAAGFILGYLTCLALGQPSRKPKPQEISIQKEGPVKSTIDVSKATIEEIWTFVHTEEGQDEIAAFTDSLREELGSPEKWLAACQRAEEHVGAFGLDTMHALQKVFGPFISVTPPGHDPNHLRRDQLSALALMADPFVQNAVFQSDLVAGILGATYHDIGNSVTRRYEDRKRKAGHGEIGGWLFYNLTANLLGETTRKMVTYNIDAHTHYTRPLAVQEPEGYERLPYWYGIEYLEVDGKQKPYGLGPILTRFCDRLDLSGSTHYARHLMATADSAEEGGEDYTGQDFYEFNEEKLVTIFLPKVREGSPGPKTVLEHVNIFVNSNFGHGIYSRDDHLFRVMTDLMLSKVTQSRQLISIVAGPPPDMAGFSELEARALVKDTLRQISGSPFFDRSWAVLKHAWDTLEPEDQARWQAGFAYIQSSYVEWLAELQEYAAKSNHPLNLLADELVDACI